MKKNIDQIIDDALRTEPTFKLGVDFKDRVTKLIRRNERKAQRKLYILITIGSFLMIAAGLLIVQYYANLEAFSKFDQFIPLAVILGAVVAVIQYLDKRLVKDRFIKQLV